MPSPATRRRWPVLLVAAVLITAVIIRYAPQLQALSGVRVSRGPFPERVTLARLDSVVTLPTTRCRDFFIVEARINGRGPYPLILDSGAGVTLVDPRVLREAAPRGRIDSLGIGPFGAFNFDADELDMTQLSGALGREILGILGQPVLAGLQVTWDFPADRVVLSADTLASRGAGIVPVRFNSRPFVGAIVGRDTLWMLLDTGASNGITLREPERHAMIDSLIPTGVRVRVDGAHLVRSARLRDPARVGPLRLPRPVVTRSVSVDLVGMEVLRHVRLTIDRRSKRARFERTGDSLTHPLVSLPRTAASYALVPSPASARIGWLDATARAAGLQQDDVVIAVNDVPWSERGCREPEPASAEPTLLDVVRGNDTVRIGVPNRLVHEEAGAP